MSFRRRSGPAVSIPAAYAITFIASFCILVIEIVAGRILAPYVGVSLYTWTSIIGVVLAGISIGAYLGGKLADRFPTRKTISWILILSGASTLLTAPLTDLIGGYVFPASLMIRIVGITTAIFLVPSLLLGMVSPVVVKLALRDLETAGRRVGGIYAVSTAGSIAGTFTAGFLLISWMGTRNIVLAMSGILILTGAAAGMPFRKGRGLAVSVLLPSLIVLSVYDRVFRPPYDPAVISYRESDYYTIKVKKTVGSDGRTPLRMLVLDNLIHSYVNLSDPFHVEYRYEKIYANILRWKFQTDAAFRTLTIGGGGYTFPRFMEASFPRADHTVVEIDPEITRTVHRDLGLTRDTAIRTFNEDGRWFVMNCRESFDIIFIDAYNDLSVPYHLTTREFARLLKRILNPGGIVLTNIIDNFKNGLFLPSTVRTLEEVFGKGNVHLIAISPEFDKIGSATVIVLAGRDRVDISAFEAFLEKNRGVLNDSFVVPGQRVEALGMRPGAVLLTDDYAPVDNLIAPVFEERFGRNRKSR